MKKASNILIIVGIVCSVIALILYLIFGFVLTAADSQSFRDAVTDVLTKQNGGEAPSPASVNEFVNACKALSVTCFVFAVLSGLAIVFSIIAKIKQTKVFYIVAIVVNFISGSFVTLVGAILGLVASFTANNQESYTE